MARSPTGRRQSLRSAVKKDFPNLRPGNHRATSPPDVSYNCIAWAAGETDRWWWPDPMSYWPPCVPMLSTVCAFTEAFMTLGFVASNSARLEPGKEKIAIYGKDGDVTHMARQLPNGKWTSKLGYEEDIEHSTPRGVAGDTYGVPVVFLERQVEA